MAVCASYEGLLLVRINIPCNQLLRESQISQFHRIQWCLTAYYIQHACFDNSFITARLWALSLLMFTSKIYQQPLEQFSRHLNSFSTKDFCPKEQLDSFGCAKYLANCKLRPDPHIATIGFLIDLALILDSIQLFQFGLKQFLGGTRHLRRSLYARNDAVLRFS